MLLDQTVRDLEILFSRESRVLVAYLFGSYARGIQTGKSDIDVAVLLSDIPGRMLGYHLHLANELSQVLGGEADLVFLNKAPPLLIHQVIKHGKLVYCRDEKSRIQFEARSEGEYLDFSRAMARYDECLLKELSAQREA